MYLIFCNMQDKKSYLKNCIKSQEQKLEKYFIFDDKKHKKCMLKKKKISIWICPKMVKWQLFNNSFKKFFQKDIMK